MTIHSARHRRPFFCSTSPVRYGRISMLALALSGAVGMLATGTAAAQSTTAGIYGSAPASGGATVTAQSDNGFTRTAPVDASGRYAIGNLPVGTYTVTLQREGQAAETRKNIALRVAPAPMCPSAAAMRLAALPRWAPSRSPAITSRRWMFLRPPHAR